MQQDSAEWYNFGAVSICRKWVLWLGNRAGKLEKKEKRFRKIVSVSRHSHMLDYIIYGT